MVKMTYIGPLDIFPKSELRHFFPNIKNNTTVSKMSKKLLGYQELIFLIVAKPIAIVIIEICNKKSLKTW